MAEYNHFDEFCKFVRTEGKILSPAFQDRLILLLGSAMNDAFSRGKDSAKNVALPETKPAFGIVDYSIIPKLNRTLKPLGLKLKMKGNRNWGDQVEIRVVKISQ